MDDSNSVRLPLEASEHRAERETDDAPPCYENAPHQWGPLQCNSTGSTLVSVRECGTCGCLSINRYRSQRQTEYDTFLQLRHRV